MHFVNNGSIVVMAPILALRTWLEDGGEAPPWVLPAPALLAVAMARGQSDASKTMPAAATQSESDAADSI
jgi:hypothetical protein